VNIKSIENEFIQHMRPTSIRSILDKRIGITPEQRAAMDRAERAEEIRLSARAKEIIAGMCDDDIGALQHYFGDGG
jgi:hypothetical protein